jgi:hypothetical protein
MGLFPRWHKGDALIDTLIVPPVVRFAKADEALPLKMKTRRDAAERIASAPRRWKRARRSVRC